MSEYWVVSGLRNAEWVRVGVFSDKAAATGFYNMVVSGKAYQSGEPVSAPTVAGEITIWPEAFVGFVVEEAS